MPALITPSLPTNFSSSLLLPQHRSVVVSFRRLSKPPPMGFSRLRSLGSGLAPMGRIPFAAKVWGCGGDPELEAELLEFMKESNTPDFPSKQDLVASGRMDLVKRVVEHGGWLSYGWDVEEVEEDVETVRETGNDDVGDELLDGDGRVDQTRCDGGGAGECDSLEELEEDVKTVRETGNDSVRDERLSSDGRVDQTRCDGGGAGECNSLEELEEDVKTVRETGNDNVGDALLGGDGRVDQTRCDGGGAGECDSLEGLEAADSSYPPSSSGRMEGVEDAGIEGILSRLGKERTQSYGFDSKNGSGVQGSGNGEGEILKLNTQEVNGRESSSLESWSSDMWREWSNRRAGVSEMEFEAAAEFGEDVIRNDEMVEDLNSVDQWKGYNHVRSCLQEMALELDSVLQLLKGTSDLVFSDKVLKHSPTALHSLSDAWEFQETEIIKAKNKLRSIKAQFAVLDGKTALKIIEAQLMVAEKQKKIHDRQKSLSLLRTACVTWPKSASEVLLAGSFDGWTSQRKMKRTSLGIFSTTLKLYPGRYEIKFVVDGMWEIDPLRPIVNNNGCQNNLLIVS